MKKRRKQEVSIKAGWPGNTRDLRVRVDADDPMPWGLDADLKFVGKRSRRVGGDQIVTGRAKYSFDINLPGLLYGKVVRSPHPAADVVNVDFSEAEKLDGVKATYSLGKRRVRFAGEEVAAVAATTPEIAREAAALVKVEYTPTEFNVDADAAMRDDAPGFMKAMCKTRGDGEGKVRAFEKALEGADVKHEATYRTQVQTHSPLESHGMVVRWDAEDAMTIWASTQATFGVREQLSDRFKLEHSKVRVLAEFVGGGFGSKFSAGAEGIICAELAKKAGAPVKLMLDRREEHLAAGNRPNSVQKTTAGVNKDGTIVAWKVESYGTGGIAGGARAVNPMIYDVGADAGIHTTVTTNAGEERAFRAPGHPQGSFALEQMIDELAEKIGMDPLEFRKKNDRSELRHYEYDLGAKAIGWDKRRKTPDKGRLKRGLGMGSTRWGNGPAPAAVEVIVHRDGSVEARNGAQDIGTGTKTMLAVVTAEELGLDPRQIKVGMGDTNMPIGPASGGSVTAISVTPCVRTACVPILKQLRELAAGELGVKAKDVILAGGKATAGGKELAWKKLCSLMDGESISHTGGGGGQFGQISNSVAGCQFAEVEVDTETGVICPKKIVAVQDCGRVVNLPTAESQVIGGVIMGISYALFEDRVMDAKRGIMLNPDFLGYKIAGPSDMPEIVPIMVEMCNGGNSIGMARLGEPPTIPTAAAIANAVANAIGKRVRSLPMTPDKVLEVL